MLASAVLTAAEEGEGGFWANAYPILPHPGELVVGLICFAVVLAVFAKLVVPMLEKAHTERVAAIEGGIDKAEQAQREAQVAKERYEAQLAGAKDEANEIREAARADAAATAAELRAKAQTEAERIVEAAQRTVEAERQQAMVSLRNDVGRLATDLAGRIVGESLQDSARQSGVIDRFIADLERAPAAGARAPEKTL